MIYLKFTIIDIISNWDFNEIISNVWFTDKVNLTNIMLR